MFFTNQEWAVAGRSLLLMSGMACFALAFHDGSGATGTFLRVWVGGLGILVSLLALKSAQENSSLAKPLAAPLLGKWLLLIAGLAGFVSAVYSGPGDYPTLLRFWLGGVSGLSIVVAVRDLGKE